MTQAAKILLHHWQIHDTPRDIFFVNPGDHDQFRMGRRQWADMGCPEAITITVELGDKTDIPPYGYKNA